MDAIHEISRNMVIATTNGEFIVTRYADVYCERMLMELVEAAVCYVNKAPYVRSSGWVVLYRLYSISVYPLFFPCAICNQLGRAKRVQHIYDLSYIVTFFKKLIRYIQKISGGPGTGDRGPGQD